MSLIYIDAGLYFYMVELGGHGNSIQIPLGITLKFVWNFHGISIEFPGTLLGIHGNPQELYIPTIPWEYRKFHQNQWGRVKY